MAIINIIRNANGVSADPPSVTIAKNEAVYFANLDTHSAHQPTQAGQAKDYWFDYTIPAAVEGQDAATSPALNLPPTGAPVSFVIDAGSTAGGTIILQTA